MRKNKIETWIGLSMFFVSLALFIGAIYDFITHDPLWWQLVFLGIFLALFGGYFLISSKKRL